MGSSREGGQTLAAAGWSPKHVDRQGGASGPFPTQDSMALD